MKVSGILPIKNGEQWISLNLPLILKSLDQQDELVIVENGSSDKSTQLLAEFAQQDSRIRLFELGKVGLVTALNTGIRESQNSWVARFDIDDKYPSTRISRQKSLIDDNVTAIFADYAIEYTNGRALGTILSPVLDLATKVSLVRSERTAHPVVLFNKQAFIEVGGYKEEEFPAEDLGLWARMANAGEFVSTPSVELIYRMSPNSTSHVHRKDILRLSLDIITTYGLNKWGKRAIGQVDETLHSYKTLSEGPLRRLLHLRDLRHPLVLELFTSQEKKLLNNLFLKVALEPKIFRGASKLFGEKIFREIYRAKA